MKTVSKLALILLLSTMSLNNAQAAQAAKGKVKKSEVTGTKAQLGTSFKFDGTALRGKYQSSLSTAATVENDKLLDDLLKGRTQFEDRLQGDSKRN